MNIVDNRTTKTNRLELGDFVKIDGADVYRMIASGDLEAYYLIDEKTSTIYQFEGRDKRFSNESHVYHHLTKYYDEFEIIKRETATLTFE